MEPAPILHSTGLRRHRHLCRVLMSPTLTAAVVGFAVGGLLGAAVYNNSLKRQILERQRSDPPRARAKSVTSPGLQAVLKALKSALDPLSGETLAGQLGLSRAGVWKRINRLKSLGYGIEGSPRRGYRLLAVPDKLLPEEVTFGLNTRLLTGPIHYFETLASTNDLAKELGAKDAPEGTMVLAESQTRGRGRLGRDWSSPPGVGLYVSLLLRPQLPPTELPPITLTAAVATCPGRPPGHGDGPGDQMAQRPAAERQKTGGHSHGDGDGKRPDPPFSGGIGIEHQQSGLSPGTEG